MHFETLEEIATLGGSPKCKQNGIAPQYQPAGSQQAYSCSRKGIGFCSIYPWRRASAHGCWSSLCVRHTRNHERIPLPVRRLVAYIQAGTSCQAMRNAHKTIRAAPSNHKHSLPTRPQTMGRAIMDLFACSNTVDLAFSYGHDIDTIRRLYNVPDIEGVQIGEERQTRRHQRQQPPPPAPFSFCGRA